MDDSWGWLVATTLRGDKIFCLDSSVTVGRHQDSCNVFVDEDMFHSMDHDFGGESYVRYVWLVNFLYLFSMEHRSDSIIILRISRNHFTIEKRTGEERAVLTDCSMNGTWVDGVKVGRGISFFIVFVWYLYGICIY